MHFCMHKMLQSNWLWWAHWIKTTYVNMCVCNKSKTKINERENGDNEFKKVLITRNMDRCIQLKP